ncbi:hypothetical protein PISMIDRAFT_113200, partial [Pisolithus microcarpus 441]
MCTNSTITLRPTVPPQARACVIVKAQVNGCEALTMIDTGSMTNFVSPAFATVAKLPTFTLASQLTLQLGCVGSHSKITHGSQMKLRLGAFMCDAYFDVANIDRYDCILGIPFLRSHGVRLKFDTNTIEVGGISVPAHTELDLSSSPQKYSDEDIPRLREGLYKKYEHRMKGVVPKMPPLREVNHRIPLIDEGMRYTYHLPHCPDSLKPQLAEKIQLY